ncbi:MAG: response regulator with CheY-like receiver domain and winged-helix DNA-binding domain [Fibrobacteres bacterium]|nr:response regulator with CheY-like receiver domain and winged-helix DNA-binding domain [Fibrobacterota bacterium]
MNGTFKPLVLLVEDDANDVLLFQRAFSKLNRIGDLFIARDAYRAEKWLMGEDPARENLPTMLPRLILLDLKLPGKSGLELLAWIRGRERLRRLPVVIFSSSSEPLDMEHAYDMGANSYIVKPAGFDALLETVKRLCEYWLELNRTSDSEAT